MVCCRRPAVTSQAIFRGGIQKIVIGIVYSPTADGRSILQAKNRCRVTSIPV
jgi:hypothetical protein